MANVKIKHFVAGRILDGTCKETAHQPKHGEVDYLGETVTTCTICDGELVLPAETYKGS